MAKPPRIAQSFKRGQVESALWQTLSLPVLGAPKAIPAVFRTRIKRLLELDRSGELFETEVKPDSPFAFTVTEAGGTGHDVAFSAFDAFCLAIALELLDAGFKQKEVVFLLRFLRDYLRPYHEHALSNPPPERSVRSAPRLPPDGASRTGSRLSRGQGDFIFMILRRVELAEILPITGRRADVSQAPAYLEPIFCSGYEALKNLLLRSMPEKYRKALVMEIAVLAIQLNGLLEATKPVSRGRR